MMIKLISKRIVTRAVVMATIILAGMGTVNSNTFHHRNGIICGTIDHCSNSSFGNNHGGNKLEGYHE